MSYEDENEQGPKALRDALEKANKKLAELAAQNETLQKQASTATLASLLSEKKVPANIQRWIKRDEVAPTPEAVDKWLEENGADFGYKPGSTEGSEGEPPKEASAQAAPAAQSVVTPELQAMYEWYQEAMGGSSSAPRMPADQAKAAVDDVAAQLDIGYAGTDFNKAVQMLQDKGIAVGGDITYTSR